jgi:hypothetical protein
MEGKHTVGRSFLRGELCALGRPGERASAAACALELFAPGSAPSLPPHQNNLLPGNAFEFVITPIHLHTNKRQMNSRPPLIITFSPAP